jgi:hypothetical protein
VLAQSGLEGAGRVPDTPRPPGDGWWGVPYCSLTTTFVTLISFAAQSDEARLDPVWPG